MSLFRSLMDSVTKKASEQLAEKSIEKLTGVSEEEQERRLQERKKRKRWLAGGIIVISILGLLFLSGALVQIAKWVLGALFVAGIAGGTWILVRNRVRAWRAEMKEKKEQKEIAETATREEEEKEQKEEDQQSRLEAELAELKRKKAERDAP